MQNTRDNSNLSKYKQLVPPYYAALVDPSDPFCPIRRQAYFDPLELDDRRPNSNPDPLGDLKNQPAPHITHRYENRVLLHVTSKCAMYCRYCFRKSLLNDLADEFTGGRISEGLEYIRQTTTIKEVIFSGGDPFTISPRLLGSLIKKLNTFDHLQSLRFHTRVPVTDPERITSRFYKVLSESRLPVVVVTHFNHPKELTEISAQCVSSLFNAKCTVLNQSVLLKGVNDNSQILETLCRGLFYQMRILPYYLHHPDLAEGTAHFDVDISRGKEIFDSLRLKLPGYLVPRYVIDSGDERYKKLVQEIL